MKQFNHDSSELRAIANLLDAMNEFDAQMDAIGASVQVGPEIWWCEQLMGHIVRENEADNEGPWVYRLDSHGNEPMVRFAAEQLAIKPKE
jgi:hypothetical protein